MYNLKALWAFVVIAETNSFRKAAEILNRSQSAISMQVKQLEEQLGIALFHRTTRHVQLTAEGEKLLGHAQRAIAELDLGLRQLRETASIQCGRISMACVPSIACSVLPSVLAEFQREHHGVQVSLRELTSQELLAAVANQDVDFGIGPDVDRLGDFSFSPIVSEPIVAVLPRKYWLPGRTSVSLEDLARLPVLLASSSAALRGNLDRELANRDLAMTSSFEVIHVQTMLAFAQAGLGVAIMPAITVPQPLDNTLQALPITDPVLERTISLITLKGAALPPASRALTALIMTRFSEILQFKNANREPKFEDIRSDPR